MDTCRFRRTFLVVFELLIIAVLLLSACSSAKLPANEDEAALRDDTAAPSENAVKDPSKIWYAEGKYKVGSDIPEGEYLIILHESHNVEFTIFRNDSDYFGSTISYEDMGMHSYFSVRDGETLEVEHGRFVSIDNDFRVTMNSIMLDGMYKVGRDIVPGRYKVSSSASFSFGYYGIAVDSRHSLDSVIESNDFEGTVFVDVSEGQYLIIKHALLFADPVE